MWRTSEHIKPTIRKKQEKHEKKFKVPKRKNKKLIKLGAENIPIKLEKKIFEIINRADSSSPLLVFQSVKILRFHQAVSPVSPGTREMFLKGFLETKS